MVPRKGHADRENPNAMNESESTLDAQLFESTPLRQAVLKRAF